ncbi:MAG: MFS transporter [Candidatus Hodarchaeales archaeon]
MIFFSLIIGALSALILGLFGNSFIGMMLGVAMSGIGIAAYHPAGLSWVSTAFENPSPKQDYSPNYNRILGIHGVGGTIGASIAELSVGFLIDSISWQEIYFYWFLPLFLLAVVFWIFFGRNEPTFSPISGNSSNEIKDSTVYKIRNSLKINLDSGKVFILLFMFAMSISWGMTGFILSPFLSEVKNFKISQAALFVGFSHLIAASGQMMGGIIGDKYSETVSLSIAAGFQVLILIGIYSIDLPVLLFILYIFLGVVNAIFWPSTNSLLAKSTTHRGSAFGLFMLIVNVVRAFGPGIDGVLISVDPYNYLWIFSISCFFSFVALISLLLLRRKAKNL